MKAFDLDDVFTMSEIIDKMGIQLTADNIIKKVRSEKLETADDASKIGKDVLVGLAIEVSASFIKNLHKAKQEVKTLIGSLTEQSPDEVSKMGLIGIKNFFVDLVQQEGFADFFKQAVG